MPNTISHELWSMFRELTSEIFTYSHKKNYPQMTFILVLTEALAHILALAIAICHIPDDEPLCPSVK